MKIIKEYQSVLSTLLVLRHTTVNVINLLNGFLSASLPLHPPRPQTPVSTPQSTRSAFPHLGSLKFGCNSSPFLPELGFMKSLAENISD